VVHADHEEDLDEMVKTERMVKMVKTERMDSIVGI